MNSLKYSLVLVVLLSSLSKNAQVAKARDLTVELQPVFAGKQLSVSTATYVTTKGDTVAIDRFRFYLSSLSLTFENGEKYSEANSYHLIDAEDPSSFLISLKNVPGAKVSGITFNIGVDSACSVSGALAGALDPVKGMYWAWNSGYINAKLEGICKSNKGRKNHVFEFHIGGYMQPYYAIRSVQLSVKESSQPKIVLRSDVSAWLEGLDLKKENSVLIPGKEAMEVADRYSKMFSIVN
jgi:hypothetical protein